MYVRTEYIRYRIIIDPSFLGVIMGKTIYHVAEELYRTYVRMYFRPVRTLPEAMYDVRMTCMAA